VAADWELVTSERRALVDLFAGFDGDQWQVPSLCPGWTVKHVLAHLASVLDATTLQSLRAVVVALGRPPEIIEQLTRAYVERTPGELVTVYRKHVDSRFAPPGLGWKASLTDVMVHGRDVAVPLGVEHHRAAESWRPVLELLTSRTPMMGSIRGGRPTVAWRTTDLDWSAGSGPEVSGTAEDVAMAAAGRAAVLGRLDGSGVALVRDWLAG
jgi:uncharacterized protein (TIGR03083 family)